MPPRLLFGSVEVPAIGGSSTASYDLFRRIHRDGYDVHYVNLVQDRDALSYEKLFGEDLGNPGKLPNARLCRLHGRFDEPHPELSELVADLDPEVMVGFGFLAAQVLKSAAPARRTVLVTGTCRQAQDHVTSGRARDAVALRRALADRAVKPRVINHSERQAVEQCDLIVTHSALTHEMMERFFPASAGKIYPNVISFAEWICEGAEPWQVSARRFDERDVDVLFVASDWTRPEKGYSFVTAITKRVGRARVHIVGTVPHELRSVTHHGFIGSRATLFDLMGRARCLVSPSRMDAAPGILFEGSVLGCNVVASKNCGNWELCHPELLADPFGADTFAACVRRALTRKYEDNLGGFLQRRSCDELLALLTAFARPFEAQAAR